jgi:hypothetical protein
MIENKKSSSLPFRGNENFTWVMTPSEKNMFRKYLGKAKRYLEFGSGGSTVAALLYSNIPVISTDSSIEFFCHLESDFPIIKYSQMKSRLFLNYVDVGKVGDWGTPINKSKRDKYPDFSQSVFQISDARDSDFVLVDGRFRVACVLAALLNTRPNTVIMVHDFWSREYYHSILNFVDVIDRTDEIGVFRIKKDANRNDIIAEYEKFKYNVS